MTDRLDLTNNFDDSVANLNTSLRDITADTDDTKFASKLNVLLDAKLAMVPFLTSQLQTDPEAKKQPNRTSEVNALTNLINNIESSLYRKKEMEAKEEVDLAHPKIQKALEWVVEATTEALRESGVEDAMISTYIMKLSQRMVGFEDEANKRLKGVMFTKLDTVDNPLISMFNDIRSSRISNPAVIDQDQ